MAMMLYIVRHGETDWNRMRKVQGHTDIPLNDYGRHLAEETAEGKGVVHGGVHGGWKLGTTGAFREPERDCA